MTGDNGEGVSGGRNLKLALRLAGFVFVALCIAFVVHLLIRDWPETSDALRHATLWWLVPAAVCAVAGMLILAWRWGAAIVAVGGEPAGVHRLLSAFFVGEAGKYIPGAVWAMLGRGELARREGYERSIAYSSVALSVIGCYLAAALTALILAVVSLIGGSIDMPWWPVATVAAIGIAAIHPAVSRRLLALTSRVLRADADGGDPELDSLLASDRYVRTGLDPDRRLHHAGDEVAGRPSADRTSRARRGRELDHRVHHSVTGRDRGS